jgi:hypothetical protein
MLLFKNTTKNGKEEGECKKRGGIEGFVKWVEMNKGGFC